MFNQFFTKHPKSVLILRGIILPFSLGLFFWIIFHHYVPQPIADALSIPIIAIGSLWTAVHIVNLTEN